MTTENTSQTESPCLIRTPAYPQMLDKDGFMQAGHILKLIDIIASESALRHLNRNGRQGQVVTASLDRTNFHEPIRRWDMINLESRVSQVWNRSMETEVKVQAEDFATGKKRDIAKSYLVFVALNEKSREKIPFPAYAPQSDEDMQRALGADLRKANRAEEGKVAPFIPVEESDQPVVVSRLMTTDDENAQSNVFGGVILSMIDEAGGQVARKQTLGQPVVGVRLDRMSFISPTFTGETVEAKAIMTKTWNTSMEIQVEIYAKNPNLPEPRRVASSYVVYVKIGPNGKPAEVPPWTPKTPMQIQRAKLADVRRQIREQEDEQAQTLLTKPQSDISPDSPETRPQSKL